MNSVLTPPLSSFLIITGVFICFLGVMWVMKLMQSQAKQPLTQQERKKNAFILLFFIVILLLTALISRWTLFGDSSSTEGSKEYEFIVPPKDPRYYQKLKKPFKINGIELPIGTEVDLTEGNNLNSIAEARFQPHFIIANLPIEKINFYYDTDQRLDRTIIQGKGIAQIFGWRCDLSQPVTIAFNQQQRITKLEHCLLASGNKIDAIALPAGSDLMDSDGTTYTDGKVAHDRWMLDVDRPFQLKKFPLKEGRLYFDASQHFMGLNRGYLAKPIQFGDFLYPQGTQVDKELLLNPDGQSYWWFNHEGEQPITSSKGTIIYQQDSVVQNDRGQIQYIMRHDPNFNLETHLKNMDEAIAAEQNAASSP